jgi:hypothetical protein
LNHTTSVFQNKDKKPKTTTEVLKQIEQLMLLSTAINNKFIPLISGHLSELVMKPVAEVTRNYVEPLFAEV